MCGGLATHKCVWLPACPVCLPEDDLRRPLPGLPQRGGVRCHLLWSSELCHTGKTYPSVWSLIVVPLSFLQLLTVSFAQIICSIANSGLSLLPLSHQRGSRSSSVLALFWFGTGVSFLWHTSLLYHTVRCTLPCLFHLPLCFAQIRTGINFLL